MSDQAQWHIRPRYLLLLFLAGLLFVGIEGTRINWNRVRAFRASSCEYRIDYLGTFFHDDGPDADGLTRIRWPDGSLEVGLELEQGRHGIWQTFDPHGTLRIEESFDHGACRGSCRYYDATGRLCAEGLRNGSGRTGVWTVYDVVGDGPRWIAFFE